MCSHLFTSPVYIIIHLKRFCQLHSTFIYRFVFTSLFNFSGFFILFIKIFNNIFSFIINRDKGNGICQGFRNPNPKANTESMENMKEDTTTTTIMKLKAIEATPESFAEYGQVIEATGDGAEFGSQDAQLDLTNGIPRQYHFHKFFNSFYPSLDLSVGFLIQYICGTQVLHPSHRESPI